MENSHTPGGTRERLGARALILASALTLLASIASFSGALDGTFILDDWPLIANNPAVHSLASWRQWTASDFWNIDLAEAQLGDRLRYFRPLVLASYALDWQLGGGSPLLLHATNLLLHGAAALLAFFTLRRWTGEFPAALVGALLFGLHPSKAETVAWISGRPDLWLTIGVTVASSGVARRLRGERSGWALEAIGAALAYASKEHAVVLPAFAFIEGWVALGRPGLDRSALRRCALAAAPQIIVAALYLGARAWIMPLRQFEITGLTVPVHVALVLETLGRLHAIAAWPADLSMMQGMIRTDLDGPRVTLGYALLGAVTTALAVAGIVLLRRRRPALALALGFWLWLLLPVSNLVWSGFPNLTSPRFLYLPLLAIGWAAAELLRQRRNALVWALAAALPLAFGARAFARSLDFQSPIAFWTVELERQPDLAIGHLFALEHARSRGRPRRALALAARGFRVTARDYSHLVQRSTLIVDALKLSAGLTTDAQRSELAALEAFITDLIGTRPAQLRLSDVLIEVPEKSALRRQLAPRHPELLLLSADIATRLGDDARALSLAERAVRDCPRCAPEWETAGLVALRARDHARAREWLAGPRARAWSQVPARLRELAQNVASFDAQLEAAEGARRALLEFRRYSLVGLAGRAYACLVPHEDAIAADAAGRQVLAEAVARAGLETKARELLADKPAPDVDRWLASWLKASAPDAPRDANDDLRFEALIDRLLAAP